MRSRDPVGVRQRPRHEAAAAAGRGEGPGAGGQGPAAAAEPPRRLRGLTAGGRRAAGSCRRRGMPGAGGRGPRPPDMAAARARLHGPAGQGRLRAVPRGGPGGSWLLLAAWGAQAEPKQPCEGEGARCEREGKRLGVGTVWGQSPERPGLGNRARRDEEEKCYAIVFLLTAGPEGKVRWLLSMLVFSGNPFVSWR